MGPILPAVIVSMGVALLVAGRFIPAFAAKPIVVLGVGALLGGIIFLYAAAGGVAAAIAIFLSMFVLAVAFAVSGAL